MAYLKIWLVKRVNNKNVIDLQKLENRKSIDSLGLLIQLTISIFLVAFTFAALLISELVVIPTLLLSMLMFVMAYNNQKTFKRKYATALYIVAGVIAAISAIYQLF